MAFAAMKILPAILLLFAITTTGWAGPTISPNFYATITGDADRSTLLDLFDEDDVINVVNGTETFQLYSDFSNDQLQFNFADPDQIVYQSPDPETAGLFSEFSTANNFGNCQDNGRSGTLWESGSIDLCASGNTPIYLEWDLGGQGDVTAYFIVFTPGVPPQSDFVTTPEPATLSLAAIALALIGTNTVRRRY